MSHKDINLEKELLYSDAIMKSGSFARRRTINYFNIHGSPDRLLSDELRGHWKRELIYNMHEYHLTFPINGSIISCLFQSPVLVLRNSQKLLWLLALGKFSHSASQQCISTLHAMAQDATLSLQLLLREPL